MLLGVLTTTPVQKLFAFLPAKLRLFLYWKIRARKFGKQSVLNLAHSRDKFDVVTEHQKREIFPCLQRNLRGDESVCLDYGCGPGRFSGDLARLTGCRVLAVDPIRELINLAPRPDGVEYQVLRNGIIPLSDESVNIIWCCLVLGGIPGTLLPGVVTEMMRVLSDEGMLILIENISEKMSGEFWMFRPVEFYQALFPSVDLAKVHDYTDAGETIAILIGRKNSKRGGAN